MSKEEVKGKAGDAATVTLVSNPLKFEKVDPPEKKYRQEAVAYLDSALQGVSYLPKGFALYLESRVAHHRPELDEVYERRVARAALLLGGNIMAGRIVGRDEGKTAVMAEGGVELIAKGGGGDGTWGRYTLLKD